MSTKVSRISRSLGFAAKKLEGRTRIVSLALIFGIGGTLLLLRSGAAGFSVALEPDLGTVKQPAKLVTNPNASGGSTVIFEQASSGGGGNGRYQVGGRHLYDPCGEKVVMRGVEAGHATPYWVDGSNTVSEIAKTGSNTVRILVSYPPADKYGSDLGYLNMQQTENLIKLALSKQMLPDVAIGDNRPETFLKPEVKEVLMRYQDKIVIHALGEQTQGNVNQWVTDSKAGIASLRAAGYTAPLFVLANDYGRNLPTILNRGKEVFDSDPLKNVVFGWQAYWGQPGNYYQNLYGMSLDQGMARVRDFPYPIQVGLMRNSEVWIDPSQIVDYKLAMTRAKEYEISWLWWDWVISQSSGSISTSGSYSNLSSVGREVAVTHAGSIQNTSVKTKFIKNGNCL